MPKDQNSSISCDCPRCNEKVFRLSRIEGRLVLEILPHECYNLLKYDFSKIIEILDDENYPSESEQSKCVPGIH